MNFRQLETFRWIAKLGNFAAAADRLNATQSTVSARILELERSLGVKLFDRSGRAARLTVQGRLLLPYAEQAYTLAAQIQSDVGRRDAISGLVRIGVGEIVALTWFPDALNRLSELYGSVEVELFVDLTVNLHKMLEAGLVDIIFVVSEHQSPAIISQSLGRTPMRWMASPTFGLGGRPLRAAELASYPIYSLSRDSHLHTHLTSWFLDNGVKPSRLHGCNSVTTMIALARSGTGIAVLPRVLTGEEIESNRLEILDAPTPMSHYEFFVVYEKKTVDPSVIAIAQVALETTNFERRSF